MTEAEKEFEKWWSECSSENLAEPSSLTRKELACAAWSASWNKVFEGIREAVDKLAKLPRSRIDLSEREVDLLIRGMNDAIGKDGFHSTDDQRDACTIVDRLVYWLSVFQTPQRGHDY